MPQSHFLKKYARMEENNNTPLTPDEITRCSDQYSETSFWDKLANVAKKAGEKVIYAALLLFYVLKSPLTSKADRAKILGALGYFILPLDIIPDWIPVAGYTDDLAALTWAIYAVAKNITPEIKQQAKDKMSEIFKDFNPKDVEIDI